MEEKKEIVQQKPVNNLTTSIVSALERGDKLGLNVAIGHFKLPNGAVNYPAILSVPGADRIPALGAKIGHERLHKMLAVAITLAMESMNLSKPLSANQIFDLVDAIIDTSGEDYLSLEDIVLFLQKLVRGETKELFSSMDIPKFMKMFEVYRQERHEEYSRLKEEQHVQNKVTGSRQSRVTIEKGDIDSQTFFELMQTYNEGRNEKMD